MGHTTDGSHEPTDEQKRLATSGAVPPGATVDRSADGSVTSVITEEDGWSVHIDPESEFGRKLRRIADRRGDDAGEYINEAVRMFIRGDLGGDTGV